MLRETFLSTLQLSQVCYIYDIHNNYSLNTIQDHKYNTFFLPTIGSVNMLKVLVKKCGKAMAESEDVHKTKPVYFAAQEGVHMH